MERQFQQNGGDASNGLCVRVMTDEQMELLRKQIAVYAMICEQLVQMHKVFSAQNEIAGLFSLSLSLSPLLMVLFYYCLLMIFFFFLGFFPISHCKFLLLDFAL